MHEFHEGHQRGHEHQKHERSEAERGRRYRAEFRPGREPGRRGGMSPRRGEESRSNESGGPESGAAQPRGGFDPREARRSERHERRTHRHEHRGRSRAQRGDVRAAVLLLLAEEPMHGYQMMHAIGERTGGTWRVSPGAIYPTIAQLEDEGLVRVESAHGRKLVVLTDAGRTFVTDEATRPADPFAAMSGPEGGGLRDVFDGLATAGKTLARAGSPTQIAAAREVLEKARRELYLILADDPGTKS